jgi:hypothetical protein
MGVFNETNDTLRSKLRPWRTGFASDLNITDRIFTFVSSELVVTAKTVLCERKRLKA